MIRHNPSPSITQRTLSLVDGDFMHIGYHMVIGIARCGPTKDILCDYQRNEGTEDAMIDGGKGILVDHNDVDATAEAIILLLTARELARRLGENGRLRVEKELSWEKVGERFEENLYRVIGRGQKATRQKREFGLR